MKVEICCWAPGKGQKSGTCWRTLSKGWHRYDVLSDLLLCRVNLLLTARSADFNFACLWSVLRWYIFNALTMLKLWLVHCWGDLLSCQTYLIVPLTFVHMTNKTELSMCMFTDSRVTPLHNSTPPNVGQNALANYLPLWASTGRWNCRQIMWKWTNESWESHIGPVKTFMEPPTKTHLPIVGTRSKLMCLGAAIAEHQVFTNGA